MKLLKLTLPLVFMAQAACSTVPTEAARPAVLASPSVESSRLLSEAISKALNGTRVALAADAFTQSSQLTLERNTQDPSNMPGLNGRLMEPPITHRFSLMSQGDSCYLLHDKTGKQYELNALQCHPL